MHQYLGALMGWSSDVFDNIFGMHFTLNWLLLNLGMELSNFRKLIT